MTKEISAFTVLELLLSMTLGLLLLALLFPALKTTVLLHRNVTETAALSAQLDRSFLAINRGFKDATVFFALRGFTIHRHGNILSEDGTPLAFSNNPAVRPATNSDSVSYIVSNAQLILSTSSLKTTTHANKAQLSACYRATPLTKENVSLLSQTRFWLGVTPWGGILLNAKLKRKKDVSCPSGQLFSGTVTATPRNYVHLVSLGHTNSLQIPTYSLTPADLLGTIVAIVPLRDYYSLYVSSNNTLRRISHIKIENQPIVYGVKNLGINHSNLGSAKYLKVTMSAIHSVTGRTVTENILVADSLHKQLAIDIAL